MTFLAAPLIGGLASAAGSSILGGLFGGGNDKPTAPIQNFTPTGINAGGLSTSLSGGNIGVSSSGQRQGLVSNISSLFGNQADTIAGLRDRVAPGFSDLRASRLAEIENARQNAIGNLRDNMARRRTLGSSFGQDALTRAENEFGQAKDRVAAESFLQELELTNQLANQEFEARRSSFQTGLDELNLEADLASKLASNASQQLGANARVEADLNAKAAAGAGKFFGEIAQPMGKAIGEGASKFFSGFNPVAGAWGT